MTVELTDAAYEFAEMAVFLRNISGQDAVATYSVINSQLKSTGMVNPVYAAYSAVSSRATDLIEFIRTVQDPYIDNETRGLTMSATQKIVSVFQAEKFGTPWIDAKADLSIHQTGALKFFSQTMRRHRPLRKIEPSQIDEIRTLLMEAVTDLGGQGLPDWAKTPLTIGVKDLLFALDNLLFLGHDEATSRLLTLRVSTEAIYEACKKKGLMPDLTKMALALVFAVNVFSVPYTAAESYTLYKGWISHYAVPATPLLPKPEQEIEEISVEPVTES